MHLAVRRRDAAAALALIVFAALAATAAAGHWPMFGGDAGHSGYQPVDPGSVPVKQRYALTDETEREVKTSVIATAGAAAWVFGTQGAAGTARAQVHRISDGTPIGPQAGVDIDNGPTDDTDTFTGNAGSVSPAESSVPGTAGVGFFVHNDDDQDGTQMLGNGERDPRFGGDLALAMVDLATGTLISDKTLGSQDPAGDDTINMRISGSPVLGPLVPGAPSTRDLYFVGERQAAAVDPVAKQTPCNPNANFDVVGNGVRGCNVPAERRLFRVTITDPGSVSASVAIVSSVAVANANLKASPSIVTLTDTSGETPVDRSYVAVGTDDGFLRTYQAATLAVGPATGSLGGSVGTPSIPVQSDGGAADVNPPIYVTAVSGSGFKVHEIRRLDPPPASGQPQLGMMDATRDQSPVVPGTPGVAGAVSAAADNVPAGGRYVVPASSNLYSFDVNDLRNGDALEVTGNLVAGTTGFSRTVPAMQGGLIYIARDNGQQLVLHETTLDAAQGFEPFTDADGAAANDGIGQPAITSGFIAFGQQDGVLVYRNENGPSVTLTEPAAGATLKNTVTLRATAFNMRSGVSSVRFLLNDIEAGKGTLVSGSPTSSTNPGVYELVLDTKRFGNGAYSLVAEATDADTGPDAPPETARSAARSVTIANDVPAQLSIGDVALDEGHAGTRDATFTITKAGGGATTVTVATADGTATAGQDYDAVSTTVTFAAGETEKTVAVPVRGDGADEPDETFAVSLSGPTGGATLGDASGQGLIRDDDPAPAGDVPSVSVSSSSAVEGDFGTKRRMTFTVSLSRPSAQPVTVGYETVDGTAVVISDYLHAAGTITIPAGQLSRSFTVRLAGDDRVEGDETFRVRLVNVTGAVPGTAQGSGLILDDELATRLRPAGVSLRLKPVRDRRAPFRFTASGRVRLPAGLSRRVACRGRVAVTVKSGRKTISSRRVSLRSNCSYRSVVTFRTRSRFPRSGRLEFRARFLGNGMLRARSGRKVQARTR